MSKRDGMVVTFAVFLFFTAITGCGTKQGSAPSIASAPASQAAPVAAPASTPASAPASAGAPLAATDGDIPGIRVAINELKRSSSAVTLKFTIYNDTDAAMELVAEIGGVRFPELPEHAGGQQHGMSSATGPSRYQEAVLEGFPR